ncbi:hypothetical protein, partial [Enterobacter cloacae complex sp. 4DZ3-17B2]|uniref:hypothetical protein n=1 Tax=Enterobacter cloacae complex sp. 4DZ3-17B2 TaxID=2511990 RepID=UPI001CA493D4
ELLEKCENHSLNGTCTKENVQILKYWVLGNLLEQPASLQRSLRIYYEVKRLAFMETKDIECIPIDFICMFATCYANAS